MRKALFCFLGKNSQEDKDNQNYPPRDVKTNHGIINVIHNNLSFVNNKLKNHADKERINPSPINFKSITPLITGPTRIEAKNIWPMSEEMEEILLMRGSDKDK